MKKLTMVLALTLMWALSAVAQTSVPPSSTSAQSAAQAITTGPWTGCIISLNGNFYLNTGGRLVQLISSESLTPDVGHTVTVNGSMPTSGSTAGSGIPSSTISGNPSAASASSTGSNPSSNPSSSNPSAVSPSPAGELAGAGAANANGNAAIKVSDIAMVSSTCNDAAQSSSSISAQSGTSAGTMSASTAGTTGAPSSSSAPVSGTSGSYGTMGSTTGQSSATSTASGASTSSSLSGCIKSSNGEYWLHPRRGADVKLNSTQDLSAHIGHEVRVSGNWENKATGSGSSDMSSGSSHPSTSTAGAYATDSGSSAKKGSKANVRTFNATNVEMVSEKCSIDKGSNAGETSNPR